MRVSRSLQDYEFEYRMITSDGSPVWVHDIVSVESRDGEPETLRGFMIDVTKTKQREEALRQSEERYRLVTETAGDAIITIGEDSRIIYANRATERVFGYGADQLTGQPLTKLMPESLRSRHLASFNKFLTTGQKTTIWEGLEFNGLHRSGREVPIEISFGAMRREDGKYLFTGIVRDVTERKQAEAAVKTSQESYRDLYDNAPDMFISVEAVTGKILQCNQTLATKTGYAKEEIVGHHLFEMYHPDCHEDAHAAFRLFQQTGRVSDVELQLKRKDGGKIDVSLSVSAVQDENGKILHSQSVWRDISERKRVAKVLLRSEERFRQLVERAPDAMVLVRRDGTIVMVNEQAERLFGYRREQLVGQAVEMLVPVRFRSQHAEYRERYFADPRVRPMASGLDLCAHHKDGSEIPVEISLSPLKTEEGVLVSSSIRDVSERKRSEAQAQSHRDELAHVARVATVGELAASIAHEVNQPLCAIVSNAQTSRRLLTGDRPKIDNVQEALADIVEDGKRAVEVISRLRALLKKSDLQRVSLDINAVIQDVIAFTRRETAVANISPQLDLVTHLPRVLGDPIQLQQVILNLIINGAEAMSGMEAGARQLVICSSFDDSDTVTVSVRDSGLGLDPETRDRIFDTFFTTKETGLGMGLSINRFIIEAHGGRLWATQNVDHGATFHFSLPVAPPSS